MNIQVRPYTALEQFHRAHIERRARMTRRAIPQKEEGRVDATVRVEQEEADEIYLERNARETRRYDHHVFAWQRYLMQFAGSPVRFYVHNRCQEMGIATRGIFSSSRERTVVKPRQLLMWEVKQKFDLSLPEIGRIFGGRDHTTVLHALRRVDDMKARGEIQWPPQEGA